ncbi:DUF3426 domain-containing protein [Geomobilimonas luticola]|uniref:Zinc-ribbon domain-containing protein n=1 Tax=Geomobilimonas luticola TaxID=1114878 RepID=A0ABS5SGL1_9BACT|nr:DUF3426 domain-containing protein [Geomobilimonas luticola]MBT0654491.1 zinc-ribbon domain-containing protein [Geomobilimonas luticola]
MIVQCDHCNTRFKLDDAKVKPGGVKVRCSKCKEIFLVKRDEPIEEPAAAGGVAPPVSEETFSAGQNPAADDVSFGRGAFPADEPSDVDQSFTGQAPLPAETAAASTGMDFDDFSFPEEPAVPAAGFPPPADESSAFGEVAFDQQVPEDVPVSTQHMAAGDFEFGETPFSDEPAVSPGAPAAESASADEEAGIDFSEFDFGSEEPSYSSASTEPEPSASSDFDFAFAANEPSSEPGEMAPSLQEKDFGGDSAEGTFSFGTGEESSVPGPSPEGFAGGFEEDSAPPAAEDYGLQSVAHEEFSDAFGGSEGGDLTPPAQDQMFSFDADVTDADVSGETSKAAEMEPLDFGDIDFGGLAEKSPPAPPKSEGVSWEMPVAAAGAAAVAAGALHAQGREIPAAEDELPPLSIASRRKGSSIVSIVLIAIGVLIVVALSGVGFYVYQEGPDALKKVGLGFMADWFGMENKEEGAIAIRNSSASFVMNKGTGELFVITGEAFNTFKKPRASIQVKVVVFGNKGEVLMQRTAYCGNTLTKEQLETLPMDKIEAAMNNQFGDSLTNLGVEPGKSIPFVAVFKDLPKNAGEFGVEVINSTVAGK